MLSKADDDILDELINKCESAMIHPLKKKKVEAIVVKSGDDEEDINPEEELPVDDSEAEESELSPEELKKLIAMYKSLK